MNITTRTLIEATAHLEGMCHNLKSKIINISGALDYADASGKALEMKGFISMMAILVNESGVEPTDSVFEDVFDEYNARLRGFTDTLAQMKDKYYYQHISELEDPRR